LIDVSLLFLFLISLFAWPTALYILHSEYLTHIVYLFYLFISLSPYLLQFHPFIFLLSSPIQMPLEEDLIYPAFYLLPTQIIQVMVQLLLVRQNPCLLVVADHLHFLSIVL